MNIRRVVLFFAVLVLLYGLVNRASGYSLSEFSTLVLLSNKKGVARQITPTALMIGLAKCESGNNPKAINPHDGGSPSYGLYQYKRGTWLYFVRKYNLFPETEDKELDNIIMDREAQEKVTYEVLKDSKNYPHWRICLTKLNYL